MASPHDTVLVSDGVYTGYENRDINLHGKSIVIRSVNGPASTIIDLQGAGTAFYIKNNEDTSTRIEGFTCRNCSNSNGAAVQIFAAFPKFSNCRFENCRATDGGAVWAQFADNVEFTDCVFQHDSALGQGGAVFIAGTPVKFIRCTFVDNIANEGAGIYFGATLQVEQCTFAGNKARSSGAAIFRAGDLTLTRSIIAFNVGGIALQSNGNWPSSPQSLACTDIFGNVGGDWQQSYLSYRDFYGNMAVNPDFCDTASGEYSLRPYSPCTASHSPCSTQVGALGASSCEWVLPDPTNLGLQDENPQRVVGDRPIFRWSFFDTVGSQTGLEIEVGTDKDWATAEIWASGQLVTTDPSILFNGLPLQDGTSYFYRVRLNNGISWGSWSRGTFSTNTPPTVPTPTWPVGDALIALSNVRLSVLNSADAQKDKITYQFGIYRYPSDTIPFMTFNKMADAADSTVSEPVPGLVSGTRYWWRVRAFDQYEYSTWSQANSFRPRTGPGVIRVPEDLPSIQRAFAAASDGDTVTVGPGTYTENISFLGKALLLQSSTGRGQTIIHPLDKSVPIVSLPRSLGLSGIIDGFTIQGTTDAAGIYCKESYPIVRNCLISGCHRTGDGGGILLDNAGIHVLNCTIKDNTCTRFGGGIGGWSAGETDISGNIISNNMGVYGAGIGLIDAYSTIRINHNVVFENSDTGSFAAGILVQGGLTYITNNTSVHNSHGIMFREGGSSYAFVVNNICVNNIGHGIVSENTGTPHYNDVWGNGIPDSGFFYNDISADPIFVDADAHNYALSPESPCIDHGILDTAYNDPDGSRSDIGAVAFEHSLPTAIQLNLAGDSVNRVVSHSPVFKWTYFDTSVTVQQSVELQVGDDASPFVPNLWQTGIVFSSADSILYSGLALIDGHNYLWRIRVSDGSRWGGWTYGHFHMNVKPGTPSPRTPKDDSTAFAGAVQLVVDTASNSESDTVTYDFQLFSSSDTTAPPLQTLSEQLYNYSTYLIVLPVEQRFYWRARSFDRHEYSNWSSLVTFKTRLNTSLHVPTQYTTIQSALIASSTNDTVLVAPGIYKGDGNRDLRTYQKSIYLIGTAGPSLTTIDCQGTLGDPHRAIYLPAYQDHLELVQGFTFQNGYAIGGGAVSGRQATANFRNCVFQYNHAVSGGAVGYSENPFDPTFVDCIFRHNTADQSGGAIGGSGGSIKKCTFLDNTALHGGAVSGIDGIIDSCTFLNNNAYLGSAIANGGLVSNSLFVRNGTDSSGYCLLDIGGPYFNCTFFDNVGLVYLDAQNNPTFINCLVANNRKSLIICFGGTPPHDPPVADPTLDHCDLFGNVYNYAGCFAGDAGVRGNISQDPIFCNAAGFDFRLAGNSPCVAAGTGGVNIGAFGVGCGQTDVDDQQAALPKSFSISQNYPNPFNPSTKIDFSLPHPCSVQIQILNVLGQLVAVLVNEKMNVGNHSVIWNGTNEIGRPVSSGIYFYRISAGEYDASKKMLLLK